MSTENFDPKKREEFLTHLRNGMRRGAAAESLDLTRKEVVDYIKSHEDFEALVLDAEEKATEHVEEALYQAAVSGHVGACKLWFDLKRPANLSLLPMHGEDGEPTDPVDDELQALLKLANGES